MDGLVFLARGLSPHLNPRVQNLLPGHHEFGISATKELGEHAPKMLVHTVKGGPQEVARLAIDFANGRLQGLHGLGQIQRLRIQKRFSFTGMLQLIESRQIHRTELRNLSVQAVDLRRQSRELHRVLNNECLNRVKVGLRFEQLRVVLLLVESGGLLLELQVRATLAKGFECALKTQAPLITGPEFGGQIIVSTSLGSQGLLALELHGQGFLEGRLGAVKAGELELSAQLLALGSNRLHLLLRGLHDTLEFGLTGLHFSQGKLKLLGLALEASRLLERLLVTHLRTLHLVLHANVVLLEVTQLHIQRLNACIKLLRLIGKLRQTLFDFVL